MSPETPIDAKEQATQFFTSVSRNEPVWGLRNEARGLATWSFDESEETLIPFWSDKDEARICAEANFPGYQIFEMSVKYFTESVLPQLAKQGILVGVNLSDRMGGIDLPASDLIAKIQGTGT